MIHEGTVVSYDAQVPGYARVGPLEKAMVSALARGTARAELASVLVRSVVETAGAFLFEVQLSRRTRWIKLDMALAQAESHARTQAFHEVGKRIDALIQEADQTFQDPHVRGIYQNALRGHLTNQARTLLG